MQPQTPATRDTRPKARAAAEGTPTARGGGSRPAKVEDNGNDTRQRVIEAAIQCILERGLYRASTNAIAERAGLTWGVIQYYFGTRETLMLAVLESVAERFSRGLRSAQISSGTIEGRIGEYFDILAGHYGSPDYLAYTQVLINLSHDPRTSAQTLDTVARITTETVEPQIQRLTSAVLAGTGVRSRSVRSLLVNALRGLSMSEVMLQIAPVPHAEAIQKSFPAQRKHLIRALTLLVEEQQK
jgi:AcrR family transcriptional regulator